MDKCKVCGCTDNNACEGGCWWVAEGLCSQCANKLIKENKKYKTKFNKINKFMQDTAQAEEKHGFFDGPEAHIFAQLQSIIKEK